MTHLPEEAPEPQGLTSEGGQLELRVALAMRGGVSLAVWIGGAAAELDLARRGMLGDDDWGEGQSAQRERATCYAELLRELGYSAVSFDVLAGASAGGLNAVIYGLAQSVGTDLEWLREVWERQGDLWRLFHPSWTSPLPYRTEAVLAADASFYGTVLSELGSRVNAPRPLLATPYLTVDLAVTLQSGPPLPDRRTGADIRPRTAHFRFRRTPATPGGPFNDLPSGAPTGEEELLRQLAYAARATSSFPGAFEPAGIFSRAGSEIRPRPEGDDRPENMAGVFSEIAAQADQAFDVMDGGVFDNIPIGRAIQAIADAPAAGRTKRILVYLDPSPAEPSAAVAAPPAFVDGRRQLRARFVRSALTALRYKQTVESSWDDLRELERRREAVDDLQARRRLFLDALPQVLTPGLAGDTATARYRAFRARTDAARVVGLMTTPGVGFLRALVRAPDVATALGADAADRLRDRLARALRQREDHVGKADATALVAATDLFISWVRLLQDRGTTSTELAEAKAALYRVRTLGQYVAQRRDVDAVVTALGRGDVAPLPDSEIDVAAMAAQLWPLHPAGASGMLLGTDAELWTSLEGAEALTDADLDRALAVGWDRLCAAVNGIDPSPASNPIVSRLAAPGAAVPLAPDKAQDVSMGASVAVGSLASTAVPDFYTFSGDEAPVSTEGLAVVEEQARAAELDRRAARGGHAVATAWPPPITAQAKLAGNQLANFAGFLSASWRTHDWTWGRADAGAGLLRALRDMHPQPEHDEAFAAAADKVAGLYAPLNRRKLTLGDLSPTRRYALVARLGLGLQRALWPLTPRGYAPGAGFKPSQLPVVGALLALRPLLVLLPLVVRLSVLVGVIVVAAGAHDLARQVRGEESDPVSLAVPLVLAVILLVARLGSLRLQDRTWARLGQQTGDALCAAVRRRVRTATWWAAAALVLVTLAAVVVMASWETVEGIRDVLVVASGFDAWVLVAVVAVRNLQLGRFRATSVVAQGSTPPPRDTRGWTAAGAAVLGTAVVALVALLAWDDRTATSLVTAAAVGVVVWAVHHGWARGTWPVTMAAFGGVLTWALLHFRPGWLGFGPGGQLLDPAWLGGAATPFFDTILLVAVVAAVFVLTLVARRLAALGPAGIALGLLLVVGGALWGTWQLTLAWPWLQVLPSALLYGGAVAAGTTLVTPFADSLEDEV